MFIYNIVRLQCKYDVLDLINTSCVWLVKYNHFVITNVIQSEVENDITMASKQKHIVLTIEKKFKIIKDLESGEVQRN